MKNKRVRGLIATVLSMTTMLSGCSSFVSEDVASYPLASTLTRQEAVDYYAKSLEYDSIVTRNVNVHETTYVMKDIEGEKAEALKSLTKTVESILGQDEYELSQKNLRLISPGTFNYIKGALDNVALHNGTIKNITGALGFYFVDVEYDISAKEVGYFNELTSLVGLDGAFLKNWDNTYSVDVAYMNTITTKLNEYFYENNIISCATFDETTFKFSIEDGVKPDITLKITESASNLPSTSDTLEGTDEPSTDELSTDELSTNELSEDDYEYVDPEADILNAPEDETDIEGETDISDINLAEGTTESTEDVETIVEDTEAVTEGTEVEEAITEDIEAITEDDITLTSKYLTGEVTYNPVVSEERRIQFNPSLINSIVGTSLKQPAQVPDLNLVYEKPVKEGEISGFGIYKAGGSGLAAFGFDRTKLTGKIRLRYVFKDDIGGDGSIIGTNVYIMEENITNGINVASGTVLIPEFVMNEFEKLIERADRVNVNADLTGLLSGKIYEDIGVGILRGYKEQDTAISKHMSTIRQVINRDKSNNLYCLEVETTTIEGAKDVDCYGTYRDRYYMVIQQQGNNFIIVDQVRISRDVVQEPPILPDSTIQKRLVALNLSGEISDENKVDINKLMSDLYTSSTNRVLRGPYNITVNGEEVTLEKGMYDCFQTDVDIVSTDEIEYMNSKLRNILIKYGVDIQSTMKGNITEWIGGYENQAEFTAEELVEYTGMGEGYYMQVYYLVSKLNDTWVIDERTILDEMVIDSQAELDSINERLSK